MVFFEGYHQYAWAVWAFQEQGLRVRGAVQELPCGHFMHSHCFAQYTRYNYTCPICAKSMGDMSVYFGMLDSILAKDLCDLPPAYASRRQVRA